MTGHRLSRDAIARLEIGHTEINPGVARYLMRFLLVVVFGVPLCQFLFIGGSFSLFDLGLVPGGNDVSFLGAIDSGNRQILKNIDVLEDALEDGNILRKLLLPPLQYVQTRFLQQGNEKVVVGRGGELFYRPSVDYLLGPPFLDATQQRLRKEDKESWEKPVVPDPVEAITDFRDQLATRGIELIVMPVPVKTAIRPQALVNREFPEPLANRSWNTFLDRLAEASITVFEVRDILFDEEKLSRSSYLPTDTHWTPEAVSAVAEKLGQFMLLEFPDLAGNTVYNLASRSVTNDGDIARMLKLPSTTRLYPPVGVTIRQVLNASGEFWQPDQTSSVLLLGDSFANIYSSPSLGWDSGAGLGEQLSRVLQLPIDLMARNDGGAYASRDILAQELARGRDRLEGKKVVIWEFAERELSFGDWKNVPLVLGAPGELGFLVVAEGEVTVTGTVAAISRSPRPGSVPYRDNLVTIHLVDLLGEGFGGDGGDHGDVNQALVYGLGMRDNELTEFATVRAGDTVTLTMSSWAEKEPLFGTIRRSPLDDEMLEREPPNWGEFREE